MGRHVSGNCPELDRLVDDACAEMGREIDSLCIPRLAGVVLGGGYGRGEGGVKEKLEARVGVGETIDKFHSPTPTQNSNSELQLKAPTPTLSNDLDFFAITEDGAPEAETIAAIGEALKPVSEKWTKKLGVDVDFAVKIPWRLKHDEERIMVQELVRGYFDVAGKKGEELFSGIAKIDAAKLPWMEAARLMMNRGMGLLFARCKVESAKCKADGASAVESRMSDADRAFVNRNINKCILGVGDAFLVSRGLYCWRVEDRAAALAAQGDNGLYARAVEWKFRPAEEPVCDLETARETWLDGYMEVIAAVGNDDYRRTIRNAARWVVRRRSIGEIRTFALNPVVRILESVKRHIRDRAAPDDSLMRDWEMFN
jgi:hypothetical protein